MNVFRVASIATAVVVVVGVMMNWADVKRYIKIEKM